MSKILADQIANYDDNGPIEIKEGLNIASGKPIQIAGSAGSNGNVLVSNGTTVSWSNALDNSSNWDTAFGWGNHASAGYLVSSGSNLTLGDLELTGGGSESLIRDTRTTSVLKIGADKLWLQNKDGNEPYLEATDNGSVKLYHDFFPKLETSATGINITGAIDAVTSITSTGNIVSTGSAHQLDGQLGIGRAAATYTLEVEGSIFATGSSLIIGDAGTSKSIIQKRVASSSLNFTDDTGADQAILDGGGQFGIGKTPGYKLDVSGDGWFDGDITINTTDPVNKTGGKITAREIVLTDPQTGSTATLNSGTGSGVSMAKVYFHSFN